MKFISLITALTIASSSIISAEEAAFDFDAFFDTRILALKKETKENIEFAKESEEFSKELTEVETRLGLEYERSLKLTKESKDNQLKIATARLELLILISNTYNDIEYPESSANKVLAKAKLSLYQKQLAELDTFAKKLKE